MGALRSTTTGRFLRRGKKNREEITEDLAKSLYARIEQIARRALELLVLDCFVRVGDDQIRKVVSVIAED